MCRGPLVRTSPVNEGTLCRKGASLYQMVHNPKRVLKPLYRAPGDTRYPYVATTYRVPEHWQTGVMTRHKPWLLEMQPQMFVEMSRELAAEKGIRGGNKVTVSSARGSI